MHHAWRRMQLSAAHCLLMNMLTRCMSDARPGTIILHLLEAHRVSVSTQVLSCRLVVATIRRGGRSQMCVLCRPLSEADVQGAALLLTRAFAGTAEAVKLDEAL